MIKKALAVAGTGLFILAFTFGCIAYERSPIYDAVSQATTQPGKEWSFSMMDFQLAKIETQRIQVEEDGCVYTFLVNSEALREDRTDCMLCSTDPAYEADSREALEIAGDYFDHDMTLCPVTPFMFRSYVHSGKFDIILFSKEESYDDTP